MRRLFFGTSAVLALSLAFGAVMAPSAVAAAPAAVPEVLSPQDTMVQAGQNAQFTANIDQPTATVAWSTKLPSATAFSAVAGSAKTLTIPATAALDGLQVEATFSFDGQTVVTAPATLTVLAASEALQIDNAETTVGADAEFVDANADAEPFDHVQWQRDPAGGGDTWTNVAEDADHRGTSSADLRLSGAATALDKNGDRYRLVFITDGGVTAKSATAADTPTNAATLTVDNVTVTTPKVVEAVPGENAVLPMRVDWPGVTKDNLDISWQYSESPDPSGGWGGWVLIPSNRDGVHATDTNVLTIDAANVKDWQGYYIRAAFHRTSNATVHYSAPIQVTTVPSPDLSLPADATVEAGKSATFNASAPTPPYTQVQWQKKAPTGTWESVSAVQPRSVLANLVVSTVGMVDNGYQYRPVFLTQNGVPHYGRVATLTVTPSSVLNGISFAPALHGFRYYVNGVDQNPATGMHSVAGRQYFFRNGSLVLGFVTDPLVPGGNAYFTLDDGMAVSSFVRKGDALRYFDATGAMRTTVGDAVIDGKNYSFDGSGNAVQVLAQQLLTSGSGPGVVRVRVVEVDNTSVGVDFTAITPGAMGGTAADVVNVTVGNLTTQFTLDQKAEIVAPSLQDWFRNFAGQTTVGSVHVTITRDAATVFDQGFAVTCPAPSRTPRAPGDKPRCIVQAPVGALPSLQDQVEAFAQTEMLQLAGMTPAAALQTFGHTATVVRDNLTAFTQNNAIIAASPGATTAHLDDLLVLGGQMEQLLVQPAMTTLHQNIVGAFRGELDEIILSFNQGNTGAPFRTRLRAAAGALINTDAALYTQVPFTIRAAANLGVGNYLGPGYGAYRGAVAARFRVLLNQYGLNDPITQPSVALNTQVLATTNYLNTIEAATGQDLVVFGVMMLILDNTPALGPNGVPNTFTFAGLEADARTVLNNLPPVAG